MEVRRAEPLLVLVLLRSLRARELTPWVLGADTRGQARHGCRSVPSNRLA